MFCKKEQTNKESPHKYDVKILPLLFGKAKRLKEPLLMSLLNLWDDRQALLRDGGEVRPPPPSHSPVIDPCRAPLQLNRKSFFMRRDVNLWQLFLLRGYKLKIEMVSRDLETLLDGSSVVELERVCVWYVWGCLWPWARCQGVPKLSLGARPGPLELAGHLCVCACCHTGPICSYVVLHQGFSEAGG